MNVFVLYFQSRVLAREILSRHVFLLSGVKKSRCWRVELDFEYFPFRWWDISYFWCCIHCFTKNLILTNFTFHCCVNTLTLYIQIVYYNANSMKNISMFPIFTSFIYYWIINFPTISFFPLHVRKHSISIYCTF